MLWNPPRAHALGGGVCPDESPGPGRTGKSGRPAAGINLSCRILSRPLQ